MKLLDRRLAPLLLACVLPLAAAAEEPACHAEAVPATTMRHTTARYPIPDVALVNRDGQATSLAKLLDVEQPVALNFIFTSCRTICPVATATFAGLRKELGTDGVPLRMVSISIDPDYDTPPVLAEYARRFEAPDGWWFLTGTHAAVVAAQKAFDAYAGSKSNHRALTFLRASGAEEWVRVEGLVSASELAAELRRIQAAHAR